MKPEMWADEKISGLSRDARLLYVGLITMADDEGRFRARRSEIVGWVFPDDDDAFGLVDSWICEIKESGLVVFYIDGGRPYGAFRNWRKHQKINKPTPSELPPPPDPKVVRENRVRKNVGLRAHSGSTTVGLREASGSTTSPHAGSDQIRSDPDPFDQVFGYWQERCAKPRAKRTPGRRKHVIARFAEGYSLDDIRKGIDGAAVNPPVDKASGTIYDDLVSVCRNGDQLERYMERADAKASNVTPIRQSKVANLIGKLDAADAADLGGAA